MQVKFKDDFFKLYGKTVEKGQEVSFSVTDVFFNDVELKNFNKLTVISVFPALNTSVCDEQTVGISNLAKKYPEVNFISISLNLPPTISEWKTKNQIHNIEIYSDYKNREFGKKFGFLIEDVFLLNRGYLLVDKNSKIIEFSYMTDIHEQIDFKTLENQIKNHLDK
ncbi:redoxin domain-containing protein [Mesomycoplasma neurolyticum]|uniref:Thiol peroxidase n=1 Tax=Mesomycoplasma neurolyticum TaxID=2120 RepID=A0A449A5Y2_9BACT|nr:redoxin domain-containing protein [Mesomycoplasma neurolyticum]VEU59646.1 thiol peroxidase [Mesomycoplasma neurolyticum]